MSAIDAKIAEYQSLVGQYLDRKRMFERQAAEAEQQSRVAAAHLAGLVEAKELLEKEAPPEISAPPPTVAIPARRRRRALTGHWQQIMQLVDNEEGFDYDTLAEAVAAVGHDANRDTLRSQMSIYKSGGLVEALGDGKFTLTAEGRRAAGITIKVAEGDTPSNENGAAEAAPDAEEVGASSEREPNVEETLG